MKTVIFRTVYTLGIALIFLFSAAKAQIIYKNISPNDTILLGSQLSFYNIDLNDDGIYDFNFLNSFYSSPSHYCIGKYSTYSAYIQPLGFHEAFQFRLDSTNIIDSNLLISNWHWDTAKTLLGSRTIQPNPFHNCVNGTTYGGYFWAMPPDYIGVKIRAGVNIYYGWIRIHFDKDLTILAILDYAYNSIPGQPIRPGEKECTAPTVKINVSGPLSFCAGDSVVLTANGSGYEYEWLRNGKNIAGATFRNYTAKTAGTYKCEVTNSCGSIISAGKKVSVTCEGLITDIVTDNKKTISGTTQLSIAPNPFSNATIISFTLQQSQKISIQIFDINGRLIKTIADEQMQQGAHQLTWNARDEKGNAVGSGMYLLKLQAGDYTKTRKISVVY